MPRRSGMPKEMFEAPQLTFTRSSERSSFTVSYIEVAASGAAPIGIVSGSMITSSWPMPWSAARSTILRAAARRTCGSIEMPSESLAMPITAAPNFATSGSNRSSEWSSAVTELISTLPWASGTAASRASGVEESMHSGTPTTSCTVFTIAESIAGSSNPGMPAFRSSTAAPASTCASASRCTVVMSMTFSSSVSCLRPVGLMRSPMMRNGCSSPIATSPPGPLRIVVATPLIGRPPRASSRSRPPRGRCSRSRRHRSSRPIRA